LDENGTARVAEAVFKDSPVLFLSDEKGKACFVAGKTATETPDGKTIAYPESSLILFGPDGKVIWRAIKYRKTLFAGYRLVDKDGRGKILIACIWGEA